MNPKMFSKAGFHMSCCSKIRLKTRSTEYLTGVIVDISLTNADGLPKFTNCPAPRVATSIYTIDDVVACTSLLNIEPHMKPKVEPARPIKIPVFTKSKKF